MFDLKYLPKGRLYLSTLIGSFCILKDKNRLTEPHGLSGEIIISKCVIVLVTYNSLPHHISGLHLCYKDAI